jgi:UDP-N-acetylmuramate dehydrogenase
MSTHFRDKLEATIVWAWILSHHFSMRKNFFEKNKKLSSLTTFRIGGKADVFCQPKNTKEIFFALKWARENSLPVFVLGGGSNLLISDKGFRGLVINPQNIFLKKLEEKGKIYFEVGVGYFLSVLLQGIMKNNLTGLEWATGIPGTIAGAISGNAGAYGGSMSDSIKEVKFIDLKTMKEKRFNKKQCQFVYRGSIFNSLSVIITSAILFFKKGNSKAIQEKIEEILIKRVKKIPKEFSAGSVFKNIKQENLSKEILKKIPKEIIIKKKIPTAWLIENCQLKGKEIGEARISHIHSNYIINFNKAIANDVLKLINICKKKVKEKFNIELEEEIKLIGF